MKYAHKVKIVGRKIDLLHTDVAATFRRARQEQAKLARERAEKVRPIEKQKKSA